MSETLVGPARNRVDGRLKVTGAAKYAVEFEVENCAYGCPVESTISSGKILSMDTKAAESAPGVLKILTPFNVPKAKSANETKDKQALLHGIRNEERNPLSDDKVYYAGQYIALVVANSIEQAYYAASLVKVSYASETPVLTMEAASADAKKPKKKQDETLQFNKGDAAKALADPSLVKVEQTYITPTETHNPIEMSGTIAAWQGDDKLNLFDSTQFVKGVQGIVSRTEALALENVRVMSPFVGGAFGCKGAVWPHVLLATMAAKAVGRPVKLHVPRKFMFANTGHRPPTRQKIALAATKEGKLQAMQHQSETLTSPVGSYVEACGVRSTGSLYESPSIRIEEIIYPVNVATPTFMRAPGECPGTFAVESAMDELAYALKIDPVQLRVINHAEKHPTKDKTFSAKHLKECYQLGAEKFGWAKRNPEPRSMRDGDLLVGWGMATATYPAHKWQAAAKVLLKADGSCTVQCATHDIGTGAYTAFTQISSELLGIPFEQVTFQLGTSDYPFGPVAGGSNSTATVTTAIHNAAGLLHRKLAGLAVNSPNSLLFKARLDDVVMVAPSKLGLKGDSQKTDDFGAIIRRAGHDHVEIETEMSKAEDNDKLAFQSWGAMFCEVKIDPFLPRVQVTRVTSAINCGRIVTYKAGRSQIIGGIVMGIGMALLEETAYDPHTGLPVTRNLAEYHVPTHADIPQIDVQFVGEPDFAFNAIGARGMGEIGNTGIAAAVANAVYHATGKRVRDLPITPDKLI